jgi:diguanylate cyclase (GGDEF)-like protein
MRSGVYGLLCLFVLSLAEASPGLPVGRPPIERFQPDIPVFPQNFSIVQDAEGIVYLGNSDGVLEFDGERWSLFRLPNREIVRSLAVDAQGRVYVGGYNTFGYLQRDATGRHRYVDLSARFAGALKDREFTDVWETFVMPEGIYFRCLRDVFFWSPRNDRVAHWRHEGRFGTMAHHQGRTLLQFRGEGLKWRDGDEWRLLPQTAPLDKLVIALLPRTDGSLLVLGEKWWRLRGEELRAADLPASAPPPASLQNTAVLDDGSAVLASVDGVVHVLTPDDRRLRAFKVENGFLSGVFPERGGGILVSSDEAIYRIAWPSEWNMLTAEHGLSGSVYGMATLAGNPFLLTSGGLLRLGSDSDGEPLATPDPRYRDEVYDLLDLGNGQALVAGAHQLFRFDSQGKQALAEELLYPRLLRRSQFDAERIFVGTEYGLRLLQRLDGQWHLPAREGPETPARVVDIVETAKDEVWAGSARGGLWRCRLPAGANPPRCGRIEANTGLRYGPIADATVYLDPRGGLVASTSEGIFLWQQERFVGDDYGGLARLLGSDGPAQLWRSPAGEEWARTSTRLFRREKSGDWREMDLTNLRHGFLTRFVAGPNGRVDVIGSLAVLQFDPNVSGRGERPAPKALWRAVTRITGDGRRFPLPLHNGAPPHFPEGDFALEFLYALPDLGRVEGQRYRARLVGYEDALSEWASNNSFTYSYLPPGHFRLQLQAKDTHGRISSVEDFSFVIDPPWHATLAARLGFFLVGIALLAWGLAAHVRRRTARLEADRNALESMVVARTADLADVNRRLEMMANIDGLTGIANRRRLDDYLAAVWAQCQERGRSLALLAVDVDNFKQYNDRRGHLAGDELLKALAQALSRCLRRSEDLLARYGGEEFLVVMPGASIDVARGAAENMRLSIGESDLGATVSIGVASCIPSGETSLKQVMERADAALYRAKRAGRNRVEAD